MNQDRGQDISRGERFSKLAPLGIDQEMNLAIAAKEFFSPINYRKFCTILEKTPETNAIVPFSTEDFLKYLGKMNILTEPDRCIYHVRHLLDRMATNNILVELGSFGQNVMIPKSYYAFFEISNLQHAGNLWLAKTLGGRFIHRQVHPAIVHITGEGENGSPQGGSGIVFDSHYVLTCRHVVSDMKVDEAQKFQGKEVTVKDIHKHTKDDVAVIKVDTTLNPVPGLGFLKPMVLQTVYTFGYPTIPCIRPRLPETEDSYLIAQRGEVTNEHVVASDKSDLFLYSAIARPGDSGGAIVSDEGYVIGISTKLTEGKYEKKKGEKDVFSPHYAGIPADVIKKAVDDLSLGVQIPYETFK